MKRLISALLILVCMSSDAFGEPEPIPGGSMSLVTSPGVLTLIEGPTPGRSFIIPLGSHVYAPAEHLIIDTELKRLQERETRLAAENDALRKKTSGWQPGYLTLVKVTLGALVVGFAGGVYVHSKF
jgi:hypothetical protein